MKRNVFALLVLFLSVFSTKSFAAHPLITDDTSTMGKGEAQIELNAEYGREDEDGTVTSTSEFATALTYGITDNIDIVLNVPYKLIRTKTSETTTGEDGVSDASIDLKWKFYEKGGLSFALKPGFTLPTGDKKRGLGSGRTKYNLFFITTKEIKPWAFHLNLGYKRNENKANERMDIWHASFASEVEVVKDLKLVGNIGIERNANKSSNINPAFILGGLIYSISENVDIDFGIKGGLNKPETDYTVLTGIVFRF
jgi:hypothetical protein